MFQVCDQQNAGMKLAHMWNSGAGPMTKPRRSMFVGFAVVLAAIAASTAVAVLSLSAQSGPSIEFRDSAGQPIEEVVLENPGDRVLVQVHFTGSIDPDVNVAQVSIAYDDAIVSVNSPALAVPPVNAPLCAGGFSGAFAGSGRVQGESASWFLCGISPAFGVPDADDPAPGHMMNLVITRKVAGEATLSFRDSGSLATMLFEPGVTSEEPFFTHDFVSYKPLTVRQPAPAPTPVATATTPPSTGGGGGGGGAPAPAPQPTATPSGPVLLAPGAPQNVTTTPVVGGVRLDWSPPLTNGGAEIISYRALVIPTGQVVVVSAPQTQATITGLNPDVAYQFQVNAVNSVGAGQGAGLTAPVSPLRPLSAPQSVAAALTQNGVSAVVSWQAPQSTGTGPVTGYTVTSDPAVGGGIEVGPNARSVTFTGLAFSTAYSFRVRARNAAETGPLSGPSNTVTTRAVVSGSPGDQPSSAPKPAVDASEQELTDFGEAVSGAFGSQIKLNGGPPTIRSVANGLLVEFSTESNSAGTTASGLVKSKIGKLQLDTTNGSGTAQLSIDDQVSITGSARLGAGASTVHVEIDNPKLVFRPAVPTTFSSGGGLATQVGADFGVGLSKLPEAIGLTARFVNDLADVPGAVTSFQLAAGGLGGEIEDPATDIAFVVVVDKQGVTNNDLGDNNVTLTVSRAWYENRMASGKAIFITKVSDHGVAYTAQATCEVEGDIARCAAMFTGAAGGFSLFGVVAMSPGTGGSTVDPTPLPTQATPTATAIATVISSTATPSPAPTPTTGTETQPTATPLSALQPTPQLQTPVNPDVPGTLSDGGGGFPLWASLLIGFAGLAVLVPAAGAGFSFYRSRRTV